MFAHFFFLSPFRTEHTMYLTGSLEEKAKDTFLTVWRLIVWALTSGTLDTFAVSLFESQSWGGFGLVTVVSVTLKVLFFIHCYREIRSD